MGKIIYERSDSTQEILKDGLGDQVDIIAFKFFTKKDIRRVLEEKGFAGTPEEADAVLAAEPDLAKYLEGETDNDRLIIEDAVGTAHFRGVITYERELEKLLEKNGCEYVNCSHCVHKGEGHYCCKYEETVAVDKAEDCSHFYNEEKNCLYLRYGEETVRLPIVHTNDEVKLNPMDILHIAEKLLPGVQKEVLEMISWCEEDRAEGSDEHIEVIEGQWNYWK